MAKQKIKRVMKTKYRKSQTKKSKGKQRRCGQCGRYL